MCCCNNNRRCCDCVCCRCTCGCGCGCGCGNGNGNGSGSGGGNDNGHGHWDPCAGVRNRAYRRGFNNGYWRGYNDATFGRTIAAAEDTASAGSCGGPVFADSPYNSGSGCGNNSCGCS